jgi:hypothetical protein
MAENSGPEKYAPPNRRPQEMLNGADRGASLQRQRHELDAAGVKASENLNEVVRRVTSTSVDEINRVIRTLENVRGMLTKEGDRVTHEITSYASLGSSATAAMWVILDNLKKWKEAPEHSSHLRGIND